MRNNLTVHSIKGNLSNYNETVEFTILFFLFKEDPYKVSFLFRALSLHNIIQEIQSVLRLCDHSREGPKRIFFLSDWRFDDFSGSTLRVIFYLQLKLSKGYSEDYPNAKVSSWITNDRNFRWKKNTFSLTLLLIWLTFITKAPQLSWVKHTQYMYTACTDFVISKICNKMWQNKKFSLDITTDTKK